MRSGNGIGDADYAPSAWAPQATPLQRRACDCFLQRLKPGVRRDVMSERFEAQGKLKVRPATAKSRSLPIGIGICDQLCLPVVGRFGIKNLL
jgi:hypothetical protein